MRVIYNKSQRIKGSIKDLIEAPVIIRVGDINEALATTFSSQMTDAYNTGQEIIPVVIDSYGGDAYALLSLLSDIESSRLPVATICIGKAMSAGAILLAHGTPGLRFGDPNATVMIHEVASAGWGKLTEMRASIEELERLNYVVYTKMAAACGYKDPAAFLKKIDKRKNADWYMDIFQAQKEKIIDYIGVPEFQVSVVDSIQFVFQKPDITIVGE